MVDESSNEQKMFLTRKKVDVQVFFLFFPPTFLKVGDSFYNFGSISITKSLKHPENLYIFPSFPSFRVYPHPPVAADGPTGLIFGMNVGFGCGLLIFGKSGSKVKGQGQKSLKICLFGADYGHRGYMWDYLGPGRVRWGTFGSMPTNFGNLPKVRERWEASSR